MENQEIFNQMMENAIVYLQDKGYIPKLQTQNHNQGQRVDWNDPEQIKKETKILQAAGLLPRK